MRYHFRIKEEKDGYFAQCIELEGCITQADSMEDLWENMKEALDLYVYESEDSEDLASLPDESIRLSKHVVEVSVSPNIAFSFMVRYHRIKNHLTQKEAARKMGFKNLYSYQRLEKKCNATLDMIARIKSLFPKFSVDLAF